MPPGWYHDPQGPYERWYDGNQWTERTRPLQTSNHVGLQGVGALMAVFVIFAIVYAGFHSYEYKNCVIQPGLFSWPSECL
jgi:hypothetical protein